MLAVELTSHNGDVRVAGRKIQLKKWRTDSTPLLRNQFRKVSPEMQLAKNQRNSSTDRNERSTLFPET